MVSTRKLMIALVPVALLTFWSCPAQSAVVFNEQIEFSAVVTNTCNGDTVSEDGNAHVVVSFTADNKGGFHGNWKINLDSVDAEDTIDGTKYTAQLNGQTDGVGNFFFKFNSTAGGAVEATQSFTFKLQSATSDKNLEGQVKFHITITPDGTVTASFSDVKLNCLGGHGPG